MPQELLGDYAVKKDPTVDFILTFKIPDNCNYSTSVDNGVNIVTIKLDEGEKDPSPIYVRYDMDYSMTNGLLTIQFEQQDITDTTTVIYVKKPKVIVTDL
ncbi:hypothetical protein [Flavobacterium sp. GT3R68]|uniref:hypothetical protein n=1 Tax=Flavobacterium sp. GT3R68 TaxID=2594437 RepID=UPI000F8760E7|nr:hypothetical protein [Flavobacterium sp. GT3R68]RTY95192.1 hypothetical protein EKL32_07110 [Flavobacterium sp. GSN2]TRW91065.1 hypothetical protein FNW07_09555 [Flavobacterium sp. GT3R68]